MNHNHEAGSADNQYKKHKIEHWQLITVFLILFDAAAVAVSYFFALMLRFDMRYDRIPDHYMWAYRRFILIYIVICIAVFIFFKLYKSIWRFASYAELYRVIFASLITLAANIFLMTAFAGGMPLSYYIFGIVAQFILTLGVRFSYRFVYLLRGRNNKRSEAQRHILLVGAGATGRAIMNIQKGFLALRLQQL